MSASERIELCQRMVAEIKGGPRDHSRDLADVLLVLEQQALALAELREQVRLLEAAAWSAKLYEATKPGGA